MKFFSDFGIFYALRKKYAVLFTANLLENAKQPALPLTLNSRTHRCGSRCSLLFHHHGLRREQAVWAVNRREPAWCPRESVWPREPKHQPGGDWSLPMAFLARAEQKPPQGRSYRMGGADLGQNYPRVIMSQGQLWPSTQISSLQCKH